jgi:hypothetical protein
MEVEGCFAVAFYGYCLFGEHIPVGETGGSAVRASRVSIIKKRRRGFGPGLRRLSAGEGQVFALTWRSNADVRTR